MCFSITVNDQGDAKFKSFSLLPARAPMGTKFGLDFVYVSINGTGTGEISVDIKTVDKIPLSANILREAQKPGTYGNRLVIDASPDPDCDPTQSKNLFFSFNKKKKKFYLMNNRSM